MRDLTNKNEESRQDYSHKVYKIGWSLRMILDWLNSIVWLFTFKEKVFCNYVGQFSKFACSKVIKNKTKEFVFAAFK